MMSGSVIVALLAVLFSSVLQIHSEILIDDFRETQNLSDWFEWSDTVRPEGQSKSSFVIQKTGRFQRAVLFTLLNPLSCGAAIAGISKKVNMDWSNGSAILLNISNQGQYSGYEFFLRHRGNSGIETHSYIHYFKAPRNQFGTVTLYLNQFQPYLKGKLLKGADSLDKSNVTQIGLLAYGGLHKKIKQHGVASLEIDWIKVI